MNFFPHAELKGMARQAADPSPLEGELEGGVPVA